MGKDMNSRQIILTILKRNEEQTVAALAKELGVTEMAVRRHLRELEKDGLIESRSERQAMGRPSYKYSLTAKGDESFPRNYDDLSLGILEDLEKLSGTYMIDRLFEQRKKRLLSMYEGEMTGSFAERIEALARIQSESGYMVEYEQLTDGSYQFIEYNCPIAKIAKKFPVACFCEQQLFENLLKTNKVERTSCIATENSNCCTYKFTEN